MTPPEGTRRELVAEGFGPTLPQLLRARFGVAERASAIVAGLLVLLVLAAGVVASTGRVGKAELVQRTGTTFSLLFDDDVLRRVAPRAGERARLETRGGRVRASVAVRPARLPASAGLPVYATAPAAIGRRIARLRRAAPRLRLLREGRARVNRAPGYEVAYRTGPPGRRVLRWDVLLVEEETQRDGVLLSMRVAAPRPMTDADRDRIAVVKSAYRSFRFGTDRP